MTKRETNSSEAKVLRETKGACPVCIEQVQARVIGTENIATVELVKYDATGAWREISTWTPNELFWHGTFTDTQFTEDSVYYLRVTQTDGNMAWSSPIWVDSSVDGRSSVNRRIVPNHRRLPSYFEETPAENMLQEGRISWDDEEFLTPTGRFGNP